VREGKGGRGCVCVCEREHTYTDHKIRTTSQTQRKTTYRWPLSFIYIHIYIYIYIHIYIYNAITPSPYKKGVIRYNITDTGDSPKSGRWEIDDDDSWQRDGNDTYYNGDGKVIIGNMIMEMEKLLLVAVLYLMKLLNYLLMKQFK
jgi:hypothetical protein